MKSIFIGIDHGGTNTTSLVLDLNKGVISCDSVPMPKKMPEDGLVEHNPEDFLKTSIRSTEIALNNANLSWNDVHSVAIANQGETSMAWSKDGGKDLAPALSWEDRRTNYICEDLKKKNVDNLIKSKTGILLDPYFSASKLHWLLNNSIDVKESYKRKKLRLGGTDTYVIDHLTKGEIFATEPGTASRTSLQNIFTGEWDNELLNAFRIDKSLMPEIKSTVDNFGKINHPDISSKNINISGNIVDSHAALFAHGCLDSSKIKATYGTGAFIEINTGKKISDRDGLLPVFIAWQLNGVKEYTLEGSVFSVGSAIDWFLKNGLIKDINKSSQIASNIKDGGDLFIVPSFTGLSAPHWISNAKASIFGMGLDTSKNHLTKALFDGIAFQCSDVINQLKEKNKSVIKEVCADGGPSKNSYLMQKHSDLLGVQVNVSKEKNMTAYGAALIAAYGAKQLKKNDLVNFKVDYETFEPKISDDERESLWNKWETNINFIKNYYIK